VVEKHTQAMPTAKKYGKKCFNDLFQYLAIPAGLKCSYNY
jgi:hypothetical protein